MIQIQQLKMKIPHSMEELEGRVAKKLGISRGDLLSVKIRKRSLDARKKPELMYVYTVDAEVAKGVRLHGKAGWKAEQDLGYTLPEMGSLPMKHRPVIAGSGPAGLFCGYILAWQGYCPIILERGEDVDARKKTVSLFWETGKLDEECNVQFGEGGAGTFSDGKLNTSVKDKWKRGRKILEIFADCGAPEEILYDNKPHIGTDILGDVIKKLRRRILDLGGEFRFSSKLTGFRTEDGSGKLCAVEVLDVKTGKETLLSTEDLILAVGHSARDTFEMLQRSSVAMEAKSFAIGVRVEHPQECIDYAQYGRARGEDLPTADYKLTVQTEAGRGVYTFCMCPGGYVVNASSEAGRLAVNGMSYHKRDGENANSAVIVTISPEDFGEDTDPLSGMRFQRRLEEKAFALGQGKIPVQKFGDFCSHRKSEGGGDVSPQMKGEYVWQDVRGIFPPYLAEAIEEGIRKFDRKIPGFAKEDTLLSAVESRTSSPVRILRDDTLQSNIRGIYPCGEGAGFAGGIMSAAMDGMKIAEAIIKTKSPAARGKKETEDTFTSNEATKN